MFSSKPVILVLITPEYAKPFSCGTLSEQHFTKDNEMVDDINDRIISYVIIEER